MEGQSREKEKVGPPRVGWDARFKELKEFEPHGRFFFPFPRDYPMQKVTDCSCIY
jgi:hypothetical protein